MSVLHLSNAFFPPHLLMMRFLLYFLYVVNNIFLMLSKLTLLP